ncbi:hypothetical protein GKC29_25160 [Micromonospora sp. WMMC415]|uniref:hypothetical protein n=1 Tax=Micromonospora sp. WMMC415 TaxID=2675222 RepID=UPI0012B44A18|nr:hypothetical protein [Micromonospora sp. WMMC415]QGN49790.1 hypothetical protein GKC29_25160 [Micromonospora sp. WMMC415]
MLSFTAVHTLTGCLLVADAEADALGWGTPVTLLLVHDRPQPTGDPVPEMRSVEFPLHREDLLTDPAGIPVLLHRLTSELHQPNSPYRTALHTILGLIRRTTPDARLLAWATCYTDTPTGQPQQVRRIDAVDTDDRLYQLTRLCGEDHPLLAVEDTPDPHGAPATYPGLSALLAATARVADGGAA